MNNPKDYSRVERNIQFRRGRYCVAITRRPRTIYGGEFDKLEKARQVRDEIEAEAIALKPWGIRGKLVEKRRTQTQLRMERRAAGLCQVCGDEPFKAGCVTCQSCLDFQTAKRIAMGRKSPPMEAAA